MALVDSKITKGNTVLNIFLMVMVVFIIYKIYKSTKVAANITGQILGNEVLSTTTGIKTDRIIYIRSEATTLWETGVQLKWAYHGLRIYDEQMFIKTINEMVAKGEVILLDHLYQEASGERLKAVIDSRFTDSDKAKLNPQWLAVLNS